MKIDLKLLIVYMLLIVFIIVKDCRKTVFWFHLLLTMWPSLCRATLEITKKVIALNYVYGDQSEEILEYGTEYMDEDEDDDVMNSSPQAVIHYHYSSVEKETFPEIDAELAEYFGSNYPDEDYENLSESDVDQTEYSEDSTTERIEEASTEEKLFTREDNLENETDTKSTQIPDKAEINYHIYEDFVSDYASSSEPTNRKEQGKDEENNQGNDYFLEIDEMSTTEDHETHHEPESTDQAEHPENRTTKRIEKASTDEELFTGAKDDISKHETVTESTKDPEKIETNYDIHDSPDYSISSEYTSREDSEQVETEKGNDYMMDEMSHKERKFIDIPEQDGTEDLAEKNDATSDEIIENKGADYENR